MLLINLIFEFCVVIVQAGCTPRAWLPSDLATLCLRHSVAKSLSNLALVCNLYLLHVAENSMAVNSPETRGRSHTIRSNMQ